MLHWNIKFQSRIKLQKYVNIKKFTIFIKIKKNISEMISNEGKEASCKICYYNPLMSLNSSKKVKYIENFKRY